MEFLLVVPSPATLGAQLAVLASLSPHLRCHGATTAEEAHAHLAAMAFADDSLAIVDLAIGPDWESGLEVVRAAVKQGVGAVYAMAAPGAPEQELGAEAVKQGALGFFETGGVEVMARRFGQCLEVTRAMRGKKASPRKLSGDS